MTTHDNTSHHNTSRIITPHHSSTRAITWNRPTPPHLTSHNITCHHLTSPHNTTHHALSQHNTSHYITLQHNHSNRNNITCLHMTLNPHPCFATSGRCMHQQVGLHSHPSHHVTQGCNDLDAMIDVEMCCVMAHRVEICLDTACNVTALRYITVGGAAMMLTAMHRIAMCVDGLQCSTMHATRNLLITRIQMRLDLHVMTCRRSQCSLYPASHIIGYTCGSTRRCTV